MKKIITSILVPLTTLPVVLAQWSDVLNQKAAQWTGTQPGYGAPELGGDYFWVLLILAGLVIGSILYYQIKHRKSN